ncbi:sigma-70 family RNA polymerase sigma factor [candidate division KSB1 bacterium]|nr:sigma-70 family RNA polymerase sigma factor [candidate division KSB1 bacterium]
MILAEDKNRFVKLIHDNQAIIHKICHVYCNNKDDKQDLYQEITLQLWKSYPGFKHKASFSTWMYRIALNTAITMTKKKKIFEDLDQNPKAIIFEEDKELDEDIIILYKAIDKLNKIEKAIVLLWLEEKSYDEIADITGLTVKNVSVKLVRVKKKLSEIIQKLQ